MYFSGEAVKRLVCDHIRRIYADSIYRDRDVEYYFRAVKRFPHVDDPNAQCPLAQMDYNALQRIQFRQEEYISMEGFNWGFKRDENLIIIDKKKRVKRLFE